MSAALQHDAVARQAFGLCNARAGLAQRDAGAATGQQPSGGKPAAAGADHDDTRIHDREMGHRNFNVVRLNSAKTTAAIRNREMIFGSLHPICS